MAAHAVIADSEVAQTLLADSAGVEPDLTNDSLRSGPPPEVHKFNNIYHELKWTQTLVEKLVQDGFLPNEIAILHSRRHIREKFSEFVQGIEVDDSKRQTGMEYQVVIIPSANEFFPNSSCVPLEERQGREKFEAHMTMTRARERLYILHRQKLPNVLTRALDHSNMFHHGDDEFE